MFYGILLRATWAVEVYSSLEESFLDSLRPTLSLWFDDILESYHLHAYRSEHALTLTPSFGSSVRSKDYNLYSHE